MEVSCQSHAPATFASGKEPPHLIEWEAVWAAGTVWSICNRETSLGPLRTPDRSTCSLGTIPTELRRLVADFSLRVTGFDPGRFYVGFVVDKVPLGQFFFLPVL